MTTSVISPPVTSAGLGRLEQNRHRSNPLRERGKYRASLQGGDLTNTTTTMVSSGQTYIIANKKAGTVCDLSGQDQKSVIGFTAKGSDNQKVRFFLALR